MLTVQWIEAAPSCFQHKPHLKEAGEGERPNQRVRLLTPLLLRVFKSSNSHFAIPTSCNAKTYHTASHR